MMRSTSTYKHNVLTQIQPVYDDKDKWDALASDMSLCYEALELSLQPVFSEDGLFDDYMKWYGSNGRTTSLHGVFIDVNPASGDPLFRELSEKRCRQSMETAKAVGASNVIFHSSCFPVLRGAYLENWADVCADFYQGLADAFDLNIYIENSFDIDAEPIRQLMKRINDPRIGVCLDIGHANYSRISLRQWFEELGEWIVYLHLSDNEGIYDDHLTLGRGTVDWKEADALWRGLDRDTVLTLEVGGIKGVKDSVSFLREHGFFGYAG
ncbi:MAG: sugar phosphate isomerase/epimerase [Lachnospiraceae bacterium]|nr:sugar phosphate isomerase/epimerase [Lachnospiraceae bacterium]